MNSSRKPDLSIEKKWWFQGFNLIAGVDEVGRGPIAGPVVAAAVILKKIIFHLVLMTQKKFHHQIERYYLNKY